MGDIISYINAYGAETFDSYPFSEVDSLVLAQLSYLHYEHSPAVLPGFTVPVCDFFMGRNTDDFSQNTRVPAQNRALLLSASASRRFGTLRAAYYCSMVEPENEKQFSALTFLLPDGTCCLSFRGTDATFVGWKEDLNLSFSDAIPAQREAAAYLARIAAEQSGALVLMGHSKGGNLAEYAALTAPDSVRSRIRAVYCHDSPGFLPQLFSDSTRERLNGLLHKTIPQTAIVGLLLEDGDYTVVESDAFAFMQHDPFSWVVSDGNFVVIDAVTGFFRIHGSYHICMASANGPFDETHLCGCALLRSSLDRCKNLRAIPAAGFG